MTMLLLLWTSMRRRGDRKPPREQLSPRPLPVDFDFVVVIDSEPRPIPETTTIDRPSSSANPNLDQDTYTAMNPSETAASGNRPILLCAGEQVEQPGTTTSSSNSTEPPVLNFYINQVDCHEMFDILFKTGIAAPGSEPCFFEQCDSSQSLPNFLEDILRSPANTERDYVSPPSTMSPVSPYSYPTMPSTPESASAMDNNSMFNVINPKLSVLPAALSKSECSGTCIGCHDAPGLTASQLTIERHKFFKGVRKKKTSNKWTCEIRISKTFLRGSNLIRRGKQWLGTFDAPCQAARALHVGRFLLSQKKKNLATIADFEQSPETLRALSEFKDSMRGMTLDEQLLLEVKQLAADYGKYGSLQLSS